jgi:hypothetical protein
VGVQLVGGPMCHAPIVAATALRRS